MKFKNLETNTIIEVSELDAERIAKLNGYPDKFEVIEEKKEVKKEVKKEK